MMKCSNLNLKREEMKAVKGCKRKYKMILVKKILPPTASFSACTVYIHTEYQIEFQKMYIKTMTIDNEH